MDASHGETLDQTDATISDIRLIDATLVDKNGRDVAFPRDAVGDRIVVVNFVFTSCQTLCPLASATFKLAQDRLGAHMEDDVRLITLTLDPQTDTPQRLREFADQFEPGSNWLWLTGKAMDVRSVLRGLGVSDDNFTAHPPATLIGDTKNGHWTQINVQATPAQIEAEVTRMFAARGTTK
ncbi:SCO family protein [Methylocystis parvus]|uniref:SCO family protein n=1 Tax=Methylocystis parvus TaxID=134 RepID=UPI003C724A6C